MAAPPEEATKVPFPEDQVGELKQFCPDLQECEEGGCAYVLLRGLNLPEGCSPAVVDALLCPTPRDGYQFRLYFAMRVESGVQLNWNANGVRILERNWHAFSWTVNPEPRLMQMVAAYLMHLK
jgi:hypothetical protein